ncbi:MAG: hypothetical protein HY815_25515 [Candidatus Riflebacteria bacterium]|nr:hypothetical protein [Candidatus Riflebacteria bacterium]
MKDRGSSRLAFTLVEGLVALMIVALFLSMVMALARGAWRATAQAPTAACAPGTAETLVAVARLAARGDLPDTDTQTLLTGTAALASDPVGGELIGRAVAKDLRVWLGVRALDHGLSAVTIRILDREGRLLETAAGALR